MFFSPHTHVAMNNDYSLVIRDTIRYQSKKSKLSSIHFKRNKKRLIAVDFKNIHSFDGRKSLTQNNQGRVL